MTGQLSSLLFFFFFFFALHWNPKQCCLVENDLDALEASWEFWATYADHSSLWASEDTLLLGGDKAAT